MLSNKMFKAAVAVLAFLALQHVEAVTYNYYKGNIGGSVLVLDVGSLHFQGNHPLGPYITQAKDCWNYCKTLPGCNAWNYCADKNGCGSGCGAYVKQHPNIGINTTNFTPNVTKLPIEAYGPFGVYPGSCAAGDRWSFGTCSLKVVPNPSSPPFFDAQSSAGWVSGSIVTPPACKNISPRACDACTRGQDPTACYSCASAAGQRTDPVQIVLSSPANKFRADGCGSCFALSTPAKRSRCNDCLVNNKPCGQCTTDAGVPLVDNCIDCVTAYGGKAFYPCASCASGSITNIQTVYKCIACVGKTASKICASSTDVDGQACISQGADVCTTCVTTATDYSTCEKCALTAPYNADCQGCAQSVTTAADQAKCYNCVAKEKSTVAVCSNCLTSIFPNTVAGQNQCIACADNPKVTTGKFWCSACINWYSTASQQAACYKCLEGNFKDMYAAYTACAPKSKK